MGLFKSKESYLGIDIGSVSIKVVELLKEEEVKLSTYGYSESSDYESQLKGKSNDSVEQCAAIINEICRKAGVTSRNAVAALPSFSVFSSIINLPTISSRDVSSAINFEAKKIIPLPLEEMILDWKEVGVGPNDSKNYLLTGAPKLLVKKYIDIFKEARLNLLSLETETFSLVRALMGGDKSTVMIVEIGARTTDISIVDESIPLLSRSIDVGGTNITKAISNSLKVGFERAEQFKYDMGMSSFDSADNVIPQTITETIAPIVSEIRYSLNLYQGRNNKKVEKLILSGGSALLSNLPNYLSKILDMQVVISNPWSRIEYPEDLSSILDEIGPKMSVAAGLAMRQID